MLTGKFAVFAFGTLFGSVGIRLLTGKDAQKVYAHATAAALRCKKEVMRNVDEVQAACADILAEAKQINAQREAEEEADFIVDSGEEAAQA